jgi:dihydroneopterin aldolase
VDRLVLAGMRFHGRHGVEAWERRVGQPFVVDLVLHIDLAAAAASDALADTVDYGAVYRTVKAVVEGPPARLIERVAGQAAAAVLEAFPRVAGVEVVVHKPHAPVGGDVRDVSARLERWRDGGHPR